MSLLHNDGFDHYTTTLLTASGMWTSATAAGSGTSAPSIQTSSGRGSSGGCLRCSANSAGFTTANSYASKTLAPGSATAIVGVAFKINSLSFNFTGIAILQILDTSSVQVSLRVRTDGTFDVVRGTSQGTVLGSASVASITTGAWNYVELKVKIDNSTGTVDVQLNGTNIISLTGQDTQATGNASWNGVQVGMQEDNVGAGAQSAITIDYDDLYVMDSVDATATQGFTLNSFQGDCVVQTILPTGDGNYTDFAVHSSSSHYANVDETTPNDDTDYNAGANVNDRDSYTYTIPSTGGEILALTLCPYVKKDDSGTRKIVDFHRISGSNYDNATEVTITTSYLFYPIIRAKDPATSGHWASGSKEIGVKVST